MTDQQSQFSANPTAQMQRTTMNQGQEALEQLLNLQRSMAQMTLSALQWQQTAQEQGMEMTRSMLHQFPGQEFSRSMLESYLQGMEAMVPEMERALERGAAAGMAAQSGGQSHSGFQPQSQDRSPPTHGAQSRLQQSSMGGVTSQLGSQQPSSGKTSHGMAGGRYAEQTRQPTGQQSQQSQQSQHRQSQGPMDAYPQTGEWIDRGQPQPRQQLQSQPSGQNQGQTYGGESASAAGPAQHIRSDQAPDQSAIRHEQARRPEQQSDPAGQPAGQSSPQREHSQQNQHSQRGERERYGQRRQRPPEQPRETSQRIDSGTGGSIPSRGPQRTDQQRPMSQQPPQQIASRQGPQSEAASRGPESTRPEHEQERDRSRDRDRSERTADRSRDSRNTSSERQRDADAGTDYQAQGERNAGEE